MRVLSGIRYFDATINQFLTAPVGPVSQQVLGRAERVAEIARENVSGHSRSGALMESISVDPIPTHEGLSANVGSNLPQGAYLEFGTRPHPITPRNPGGLLISYPDNPDPLLQPQRSVNHPGNQPYPWLLPALESVFH